MTTSSVLSAKEIISELNDAKSDIASNLKGVKVTVVQSDYPDIYAAILGLFGSSYASNGVANITFDMITECMRITREAGKGKAQELIK